MINFIFLKIKLLEFKIDILDKKLKYHKGIINTKL
jgi:hypothetical protein